MKNASSLTIGKASIRVGVVGIGTLITVFGIGYCVQIVYKVFKLDINSLKHKNLKQGFIFMNECITNQSNSKMIS